MGVPDHLTYLLKNLYAGQEAYQKQARSLLHSQMISPLKNFKNAKLFFSEIFQLKLKLQYFGHLMQRANSLEETLMLGKIEGKRRSRQQR